MNRMIKVLIADDEKNICLMIQKLISWEEFGMEVVGLANTGVDAVRLMEEERPEIVISDIRMPGYDGLEVVQKAHDLGLSIDFVIISGYKYFEYAHKALTLGVEHYLLKPIDKGELEETLSKILRKRKQDIQKEAEAAEWKEQARHSRRKVQKHFLSSIMEKSSSLPELDLNRVNTEFQCEFEQGCFVAIFAKLDSESRDQDVTGFLHILEEIIDRDLQESDKEYINSIMKSGVISIVNYRTEIRENTRAGMEKPFVQMKRELEKFRGYHITVGIGGEKSTLAEIADSIQEAIYAIKCRGKAGLDKIIYYDSLRYQPVPMQEILGECQIREMEKLVESLDYEAFRGEIVKAHARIKSIAFYTPAAVYEYLEQISEILQTVLKNYQIEAEILRQLEEEIQKTLDFYTNLDEMVYRFSELVRSYFEKMIAEKKNKSQLPIRMAKQYLQENYSRSVSLEDVAEAIGLSPAYLSTMFKKELGINFSDFLISCRMEAAKELLKGSDLPIAEVAERVGYLDSRYFSKTFHKVVGLKPSVYRKMYR